VVGVALPGQARVQGGERLGREDPPLLAGHGQVHGLLEPHPHPGRLGLRHLAGLQSQPLEVEERDGAAEGAHGGGRHLTSAVEDLGIGPPLGDRRVGGVLEADRAVEENVELAGLEATLKARALAVGRGEVAAAGGEAGAGRAVAELEDGRAVVGLARGVDAGGGRLAVEARRLVPLLAVDQHAQGRLAAGALWARHVGERLLAQREALERCCRIAVAQRLVAHALAVRGARHVAEQHGGLRVERDG